MLSSRAIALKRRREQQCRAVVVRHEPQHLHVIKLAFNMKVSWLFLFVWLLTGSHRSSATTVPSKRTEGCVLRSEEGARVLSGQQTVEQKQRLRGPKALSAPR